jgi:nitrite reductase/ring-hydroxylating ferredoxin subunit
MKKIILIFLIVLSFLSCSDNGFNNKNPYLPNYTFTYDINLNLATYSNLKYVSNAVYIAQVGVKGIYVFNAGGGGYNAFDAACPNQAPSSCSTMTLNGINLVCPCDEEEYSLFTGQGKLQYPLKQYRVEVNGNIIRVYN